MKLDARIPMVREPVKLNARALMEMDARVPLESVARGATLETDNRDPGGITR